MAIDGQGTVYIDLGDFTEWVVERYLSFVDASTYQLGPVEYDKSSGQLLVDYAFSSDNDPNTWLEKPPAVTKWEEE